MTQTLTQTDIETLAEIAALMIPASAAHDLPGANDPAILAEIVADANANASAEVKAALAAWAGLSATDTGQRVAAFQARHADRAATLQAVVNRVYYRNDAVMRSLGMETRAPFPKGFEVDAGDWSILDPVRAMAPIWRPTSTA